MLVDRKLVLDWCWTRVVSLTVVLWLIAATIVPSFLGWFLTPIFMVLFRSILCRFCVDLAWVWPCLLTAAGIVSLDVCLVGLPATSNRTSDDENTVGIGCRHRGSSCNWTRDFILRRILPLTYRILGLSTDR